MSFVFGDLLYLVTVFVNLFFVYWYSTKLFGSARVNNEAVIESLTELLKQGRFDRAITFCERVPASIFMLYCKELVELLRARRFLDLELLSMGATQARLRDAVVRMELRHGRPWRYLVQYGLILILIISTFFIGLNEGRLVWPRALATFGHVVLIGWFLFVWYGARRSLRQTPVSVQKLLTIMIAFKKPLE